MDEKIRKTLTEIAAKHTAFRSLEVSNSDEQDFETVSVWALRDALLAAFEAGRNAQVSK